MPSVITRNYEIERGDDWIVSFRLKSNGVAIDLTGYTFEVQIRVSESQTARLLYELTGSEITVVEEDGLVTLHVVGDPTTQNFDWRVGFYAVRMTNPSSVRKTILQGRLKVNPSVIA
jgi:hypothetical protein